MDEREEQLRGYGQLSKQELAGYFDGKDDLEEDMNKNRLPTPPKKGELIICQLCEQPVFPRQKKFLENESIPREMIMSANKTDAKREYNFHIHSHCRDLMLMDADRQTPGLLAEREETERTYLNK